MTTGHDLLLEPLLSWRGASRQRHATTLPGILANLASGELSDFPRLRAYQLDAWCMFLTQLAAIALHRAGQSDPCRSEDAWRSLLLGLTGGAHEPWCLVVEDLSKPAFFQAPVPEGSLDGWSQSEYPDDIDVLVTSKNHDLKASVLSGTDIEPWIFSIVSLQTMQGYPGRGYNRIARMKGGYGSRPRVGLAPNHMLGARFGRDVQVLLDTWTALVARGFDDNGLSLTWLVPWDGDSSLTMTQLSPHFIEICWRIRVHASPQGVSCAYTTTASRRCLSEIENGDVGDPWIPIEREGGALTVGKRGFVYDLLTKVLFEGEFESAAAQKERSSDTDPMLFLASAMPRGQGKTEGLHGRALLLTGPVRRRLGRPDSRDALGKRSGQYVQLAKKMRSNVLFPALKKIALGDNTVHDEFDARVDEVFFDSLFATLEDGDAEAQMAWQRRLHEIAWAQLQRAIDRCCVPSAQWYRAVSEAESMFGGCLRKQFPSLAASPVTPASPGAAQ